MNLPALIAGALTLTAFIAHVFVGAKECYLFAPEADSGKARQAWVQTLAAFHWVSVDLLASAALLLAIGASDVLPHEPTLLAVLSGYFAASGTAYLATVALAGGGVEGRYLKLGQWLFCFVVSALAFVGR